MSIKEEVFLELLKVCGVTAHVPGGRDQFFGKAPAEHAILFDRPGTVVGIRTNGTAQVIEDMSSFRKMVKGIDPHDRIPFNLILQIPHGNAHIKECLGELFEAS